MIIRSNLYKALVFLLDFFLVFIIDINIENRAKIPTILGIKATFKVYLTNSI